MLAPPPGFERVRFNSRSLRSDPQPPHSFADLVHGALACSVFFAYSPSGSNLLTARRFKIGNIHANQSLWAASGRDGGRESYSRNPDILSARGTALTATITSRPQCSHNTRTWPSGVDPCFGMVLL